MSNDTGESAAVPSGKVLETFLNDRTAPAVAAVVVVVGASEDLGNSKRRVRLATAKHRVLTFPHDSHAHLFL